MGMLDKFRNFMGMSDDEEYEENEEMDFVAHKQNRNMDPDVPPHDDGSDAAYGRRQNKVVNIAATTQLQVVLVKPERFDDASSIADHLNAKRTVVLNLESTNKEVSRRLVDFLSGVAYANEGQIKRVANSTFIITPYNVDFVGDLLDELESSGVFF
jgi:cell division inhibitor SepF